MIYIGKAELILKRFYGRDFPYRCAYTFLVRCTRIKLRITAMIQSPDIIKEVKKKQMAPLHFKGSSKERKLDIIDCVICRPIW